MASESLRADRIVSSHVIAEPLTPTKLTEKQTLIASVTIWNCSDRNIGIGGPELTTADHLLPGSSYTSRVRDLSRVHVYHTGPGPLRIQFTYEV